MLSTSRVKVPNLGGMKGFTSFATVVQFTKNFTLASSCPANKKAAKTGLKSQNRVPQINHLYREKGRKQGVLLKTEVKKWEQKGVTVRREKRHI